MRIALIIISLLLLTPRLGFSANSKVGTSAAQFLKIGAGARPTAMGDAFVGLADDVNAVYFNPAGLAFLKRPEFIAMQTQWVKDMNYNFGAFSYPTEQGAFAISAATLKVDDLQRRDSSEALQGTFDGMDAAYAFSYARNLGPLVSVGVTGRLLEQRIDSTSAKTWSGDIGIIKRLGQWPLSLGAAIRHFGQKVKFRSESDPLPLTTDVGVGAILFDNSLRLGLNIKKPNDNDLQFGLGAEWRKGITGNTKGFLRAGYNSSYTDPGGANGLTIGAGLGIKKLSLDFAWVPFGDLGNTFRYALHFRF